MTPSLAELVELRLRRRQVLGLGALALMVPVRARAADPWHEAPAKPTARLAVASGHRAQVLLRWGDPISAESPPFTPHALAPAAAAQQVGFNCDHLQYFPLPRGSERSDRGILAINHEYSDPPMMFSRCDRLRAQVALTEAQIDVEIASHGVSLVEVARRDGAWFPLIGALNRRVTGATPLRLSGPAAGHRRLCTAADPAGSTVLGTLSNCAGGRTPWGTYLTAEENFHQYFAGPPLSDGEEAESHARYRLGSDARFGWARWHERFELRLHRREPNRFGWIVEIDPYDPRAVPVKRTALGRAFHECATVAVSSGGEVAVYSGDDAPFEYLYKFVSRAAWTKDARDLLDEGTLFVARFEADGRVEWSPLVHGLGALTEKNGFASQADVLIETRRAADLVGATPLDRPEDVEVCARTGAVYIALSRNDARTADRLNGVSPRALNRSGHVLVIHTAARDHGFDHAAREARWDILLMAGQPGVDGEYTRVGSPSADGWITNPDNLALDPDGRLWIATDGQNGVGRADGLHLLSPGAGPRRLLSAPIGAEVTGPTFTPDGRTLFVSIQHPGEGSSFDMPSTRWPDFRAGMPPRPSVIAITADDDGPVGG